MINIVKWMGVDISDIQKIYGVDKNNIVRFMAWDMPPEVVEGELGLFMGGSGSIQSIEYVVINTTSNASSFANLEAGRTYPAGCSNAGNNRGLVANAQGTKSIEYVTINTLADGQVFGNQNAGPWSKRTGLSNGTNERGVFGGGTLYKDDIDYVTISTLADAADFGNLTIGRHQFVGCSNGSSERGLFGGGQSSGPTIQNRIDYITINSAGNATDLCDLSVARFKLCGLSNGTNDRGVFGGGHSAPSDDDMDYKTISTSANAVSFGALTASKESPGSASSGLNERGLFAGGAGSTLSIDYITITTPAAAGDFGDFTVSGRYELCGLSNAGVG